MTKQGVRDKKAKRWTRKFVEFEQSVRNAYPRMPSPKSSNWRDYIKYRLQVMKQGLDVYTTEKYTRLQFDKYIESNRVCDKVAALLVSKYLQFVFLILFFLEIFYMTVCYFHNRQMASHRLFTWVQLKSSRIVQSKFESMFGVPAIAN